MCQVFSRFCCCPRQFTLKKLIVQESQSIFFLILDQVSPLVETLQCKSDTWAPTWPARVSLTSSVLFISRHFPCFSISASCIGLFISLCLQLVRLISHFKPLLLLWLLLVPWILLCWSSPACILWSFTSQPEWLVLRDIFVDNPTKGVPYFVIPPYVNSL